MHPEISRSPVNWRYRGH